MPQPSLDREEFLQLRDLVLAVPLAANVAAYAVRLCGASRPEDPRSDKYVRDYVAWAPAPAARRTSCWRPRPGPCSWAAPRPPPTTSRALALPILRHRIIVNHRAVGDSITSADVVGHLLKETAP